LPPNATRADRNAAALLVSGFVDAKTGIAIAMGAQPTQKPSGPPLVAQTDGKLRRKQLAERERFDAEREKANARERAIEDRKALVRDLAAELRQPPAEAEPAADPALTRSPHGQAIDNYVDLLRSGTATAEQLAEAKAAMQSYSQPPAQEGGSDA
jgi:hypothetical protein